MFLSSGQVIILSYNTPGVIICILLVLITIGYITQTQISQLTGIELGQKNFMVKKNWIEKKFW